MKKVTLYISRVADQPGYYLVVVNGEGFREAENKRVGARIRGADTWFDDSLFGIDGFTQRVDRSGSFSLSKVVLGSQLNEDWGKDEIYALVSFEDIGGNHRSNTVTGYF